MKVIKPGNQGKGWTLNHYCTGWGHGDNGCNALLELERDDLRFAVGYGSFVGDMDYKEPTVAFKCVCCGCITDLGRNEWPPNYNTLIPYKNNTS